MAIVTLSSLRERTRQRADMVYSKFVSDAEFNSYINGSAQELYDLLIQANENYAVTTTTFSLGSGVSSWALPSDCYKILGVDRSISGGWYPVRPFGNAERGLYQTPAPWRGVTEVAYQIVGSSLEFLPAEAVTGDYRFRYAPFMTLMSSDSDTFNGYNGFEEYIVIDAAIKAKDKEESDTRVLERAKLAMRDRINAMVTERDQGEPGVVQDVRTNCYG